MTDHTTHELAAEGMSTDLSRYMDAGQNPQTVSRFLDRVQGICTSGEEVLYMAIQQRPVANFSPDAIVLTNKRFIVFRQKVLGRFSFVDCQWIRHANAHMQENVIGATVTMKGLNGHTESLDYLPKAQAKKVYRIAQEMEERMHVMRREMKMEEDRNAAGGVVVQNAISTAPSPPSSPTIDADPVANLKRLKEMLDAGLISDDEFTAKKKSILDSM